jgi:hypothetical protein
MATHKTTLPNPADKPDDTPTLEKFKALKPSQQIHAIYELLLKLKG